MVSSISYKADSTHIQNNKTNKGMTNKASPYSLYTMTKAIRQICSWSGVFAPISAQTQSLQCICNFIPENHPVRTVNAILESGSRRNEVPKCGWCEAELWRSLPATQCHPIEHKKPTIGISLLFIIGKRCLAFDNFIIDLQCQTSQF